MSLGLTKTKKTRKPYRGKWGGLPATKIAALMGVSNSKAKRFLYALKDHFGEEKCRTDDDLIGMAIQEMRNKEELKRIKKLI